MGRSVKEQQRIDELHKEGKPVFLNSKGHLCFRQRYPDFPMYVSAIVVFLNLLILIAVILLKQ